MKLFINIIDWLMTAICGLIFIAGVILATMIGISLSAAGGGVFIAIVVIIIIIGAISSIFTGEKP